MNIGIITLMKLIQIQLNKAGIKLYTILLIFYNISIKYTMVDEPRFELGASS